MCLVSLFHFLFLFPSGVLARVGSKVIAKLTTWQLPFAARGLRRVEVGHHHDGIAVGVIRPVANE